MKLNYVVLKRNGFDIVDADTRFYGFLGAREYWAFDRIIDETTVDQFYRYLRAYQLELEKNPGEKPKQIKFFLRLYDEKSITHPYICWFTESTVEEMIKLYLVEIDELMVEVDNSEEKLSEREMILSLYNDVYFDYDPKTNLVCFFYMIKGEQKIFDITLEELEKDITGRVSEEDKESVKSFANGLRNGQRHQEITVNVDVTSDELKPMTSFFMSGAIYDESSYIKSCGFLHRTEGGTNINKKVELDSLTGVMTKAEITSQAINLIDNLKTKNITIAIIDVDYFKNVNDTYGHLKGDEILRKVSHIIEDAVGTDGTVGRIGGDEFMVIFYDAYDMENMRENLRSIKNHVNAAFPADVEGEPKITLSIGCAGYPKDAKDYENTFLLADLALYRAKERGRDRYIIYDVKKHGDLEAAKKNTDKDKINGRGNLSKGDILCMMTEKALLKKKYTLQNLLDDFVVNFDVHRIIVYSGSPYKITHMAGEQCLSSDIVKKTQDYVSNPEYQAMFDESGMLLRNDLRRFADKYSVIYEAMMEQNLNSIIQIKATDADGLPIIVSFETVQKTQPWNKNQLYYYRLFARTVGFYSTTE